MVDTAQVLGYEPGPLPLIIGRFFKSNVNEKARRVMLIFLTVNTLDPSGRPITESVVRETTGE